MTMQSVTISVREGDRELTITREIDNQWPGFPSPHITELIEEVSLLARGNILRVEEGAIEVGG